MRVPFVAQDAPVLLGVGYIALCGRDGRLRAWVVVDLADFAWLKTSRWHLSSGGYACSRRRKPDQGHRWMHREVMGLDRDDPHEVDHIDRDRPNNRRSNLRIVTHAQNRQNTPVRTTTTSRHRGVSFDRSRGKWMAHVRVGGQQRNLGRFDSEEAAAAAALAFRREHMPFATD